MKTSITLVFLFQETGSFKIPILLESSQALIHRLLVAIDKVENIFKKGEKVDKTLAKKHKMLYNIIIKLKKEWLVSLYKGRKNLRKK